MSESLDLDALDALDEAATPGPWELGDGWVFTEPVYEGDNRLASVHTAMKFMDEERATDERARIQANLAFIAAARTAVPALIKRVRDDEVSDKAVWDRLESVRAERDSLRARLEAAERERDHYRDRRIFWIKEAQKNEDDLTALRDAITQLADWYDAQPNWREWGIGKSIRRLIQSDTGGTNE